MTRRTRFRIRWADIAACIATCAAALILASAFMERIPA